MVRLLDPAHTLYASHLFHTHLDEKKFTLAAAHLHKCVKLLSSQVSKAFDTVTVQRTAKDVKLFK